MLLRRSPVSQTLGAACALAVLSLLGAGCSASVDDERLGTTSQALTTGDVHFALVNTGPIFAAIRSGKVRGVALPTPARDAAFPDVPSVVEAGFPELEMRFWMGLLAPAATPAPIVRRLEAEMLRIVALPDVVKQLQARQVTPAGLGSEEFAKFIASEIARWDATRKAANISQLDL